MVYPIPKEFEFLNSLMLFHILDTSPLLDGGLALSIFELNQKLAIVMRYKKDGTFYDVTIGKRQNLNIFWKDTKLEILSAEDIENILRDYPVFLFHLDILAHLTNYGRWQSKHSFI